MAPTLDVGGGFGGCESWVKDMQRRWAVVVLVGQAVGCRKSGFGWLLSSDSATQVVDSELVITETNQLQSSNSTAQDVDFEDKEEDAITETNSNS
nr:hypothetical protein CFP56_64664 [Quercus suber]